MEGFPAANYFEINIPKIFFQRTEIEGVGNCLFPCHSATGRNIMNG